MTGLHLRVSSLACATALLLAACGGATAPSSAPVSSSAAAAAKPSAAAGASVAASAAPAKPAASAVASAAAKPAGSAAAGGAIKLGFVEPTTGPQAVAGIENNDGFKLYLESVNNTIAGRTITPVFADDQAQADVGLTKSKQLVENEKVSALMGFTFTPVTYAAATYVKNTAHVPMLVTGNAAGQGLMLDPNLTSPYLMRFTSVAAAHADVSADWSYKQGFRKMVVVAYDTAAGIEVGDLVASAFISRGGSVIQEMHPPIGTADFGPYLAPLDPSADVVVLWEPGADGLRYIEQFANYAGQKRPTVIDMGGAGTSGNLNELKDKGIGVVTETTWVDGLDNAQNQAFLKAFKAKYPTRSPSPGSAMGWSTGAILDGILKKTNGNIEDTQAFLQAAYGVDVQSAMGEIKLDPQTHDIVRSYYVSKLAKKGDGYGYDLLATYNSVSQFWDRKPEDLKAFPYGKLKGKWVGMTKDQLAAQHGLTSTPAS